MLSTTTSNTEQSLDDSDLENAPLQQIDSDTDTDRGDPMWQIKFPKHFAYALKYLDITCIMVTTIQIVMQHYMIYILYNLSSFPDNPHEGMINFFYLLCIFGHLSRYPWVFISLLH